MILISRLQAGFLHFTQRPRARASASAQTGRLRPQNGQGTGVRSGLAVLEPGEESRVVVLHRDNPGASFQGVREGKYLFALFVFLPHPPLHAGGIGGADVEDLPHGGLFGQAEEEGAEPPPVEYACWNAATM